jgi:putative endopeptidase
MKAWTLSLCAAAALLSAAPALAADAPANTSLQSPKYGAWGFDFDGRDAAVSPGQDFFRYADGGWLDRTEIPADRSNYGVSHRLRELSDARVRDLIETSAANPATHDQQLIAAFYKSFMDEARVEQLGAKPIAPELAAVRAATTRPALARLMGRAVETSQSSFFSLAVDGDPKHPDHATLLASQAGLGLPDREYYIDPQFEALRGQYKAYVAQQLKAIGWPEPERAAQAIFAMESAIAKVHWTQAESRDSEKIYNPMDVAALEAKAPGFPWRDFMLAAHLASDQALIVNQPSAFTGIARVFGETPVETLQAWLAFNLVDNASPLLSKRFVDANFEFRSKALQGQPQQRARWKRGVSLVNGQLNHAVGQLYAERYFTADARAKMDEMIRNLRTALAGRIEKLAWMSPETKAQAQVKLAKFGTNIGAPPRYRDYSGLSLKEGDLLGDNEAIAAFNWAYYRNQIGKPLDRQEWDDAPQTVNAWYRETRNDITFPAGILQPPFFDPDADMAVNYGAIGGVIGHEITHGFDDQGRKSDGDGMLRDWWTAEDAARFQVQADRLGAQYETIAILPNAKIDGKLTMGENIADLGGLLLALDAYHASLHGQPAPVIDGLTGDQRVFLGWAQVWRAKYREGFMRQILVSDPHSPPMARVNGVVRNVDAWYQAFGVKPGDALYVPPEQRVRIW